MATTDLGRFLDYVRAFELAWLTEEWGILEPLFAGDARHVVHNGGSLGGIDEGRAAVIAGLRASVHGADRRFDARLPEIVAGPATRADGVWMRYRLTLRRAGVPELSLEGEHVAAYGPDGRIRLIEETLPSGTGERVAAYLAEHGAALRPAGSPPALDLSPEDRRDVEATVARALARFYGGAKSEQDVDAALAVCADDFVLETPPLGLAARGKAEVEAQLRAFFAAFPDYRVTLDRLVAGDGSVACSGTARMTFAGPFLGFAPTGRAAELPFSSAFTCAGGALGGERFDFDLATLCAQLGLPVAEVQQRARALVSASGSAPQPRDRQAPEACASPDRPWPGSAARS